MEAPDRRRQNDINAYEELSKLYGQRFDSRLRLSAWKSACDMLAVYTRNYAVKGPAECSKRIEFLKVSEPVPMKEDYYPGDSQLVPTAGCALLLDLVERQFELSRAGYPAREDARQKELLWAVNLQKGLKAAEAARNDRALRRADGQAEATAVGENVSGFPVAEIVETSDQLELLFREKRANWVLAGFGSVLVQRRNELQPMVDDHRSSHRRPVGRRVNDARDLERLVNEVNTEIIRLAECLVCYTRSAPFQRLFGDRELYAEPTPADVIAAAEAVVDFYRANLILARTVREVIAHPELDEIVGNIERLVDMPLDGVDQWITKVIGLTGILPALERSSVTGPQETHTLALGLRFDDALLERIRQQVGSVPGRLSDSAYLRKWNQDFKNRNVAVRADRGATVGAHEVRIALGLMVAAVLFLTSCARIGLSATMDIAAPLAAIWMVITFIGWLTR